VTEAPHSVGGYRLVRPLGGGGMGEVYEAEEPTTRRRVAVKLIASQYAAAPGAVERFRQEGRLASMIAHPRCVFVLAADEEAGRPYIVMELMSGTTLQELVEKQGALVPADAVAKILDVIDGLQEAHRLGVIHRDVKPSNCFLLSDGRVKVGDFGLAKSLVQGANLTRTGAFLGTLLYAPPEQIKGLAIDFRTDVYSVAATLYHLLTGQPPFQGKDAAATLARTVSEAPPPLRLLRPAIPRGLERVVLRGLAREPGDRWRDLVEFRAALLPFAPRLLPPGGLGARFAAFLIDLPVIGLFSGLVVSILMLLADQEEPNSVVQILGHLAYLAPLAVLEGLWGWSLGKLLLRLRVVGVGGSEPPGLARGAVRVGLFYGSGTLLAEVARLAYHHIPEDTLAAVVVGLLDPCWTLLLLITMRARNGYRGIHEFLSGTRVVQLPWPEPRVSLRGRRADRPAQARPLPPSVPSRVGPFVLQGLLQETEEATLLSGQDPVLGRDVWIRLSGPGAEPVGAVRRDVGRPTRLRWLAGGAHDGLTWDAFLAPQGCPLADVVSRQHPLVWREARPILLQLADELVAACADGTLPAELTPDQVWVQSNARAQLLDVSLGMAVTTEPSVEEDLPASRRALALLRQTACLALEGHANGPSAAGVRIRAPVPGHASAVLDRLTGVRSPYAGVEEAQADLIALHDQLAEVNGRLRAAHLVLLALVLTPWLLVMCAQRYVALGEVVGELSWQVQRAENVLVLLADRNRLQALDLDAAARQDLEQNAARWGAAIRRKLAEDQARLEAARRPVVGDLMARFFALEDFGRARRTRQGAADGNFAAMEIGEAVSHARRDRLVETQAMALGLIIFLGICVLVNLTWVLIFRGGLTFRLVGIVLRRRNGRPALRVQCAWRAFLFWLPLVTLIAASVWVQASHPERSALAFWLLCGPGVVLLVYLVMALWFPRRALHDYLARTYLVPR
jgi:hypothetical protein